MPRSQSSVLEEERFKRFPIKMAISRSDFPNRAHSSSAPNSANCLRNLARFSLGGIWMELESFFRLPQDLWSEASELMEAWHCRHLVPGSSFNTRAVTLPTAATL